MVKRLLTATSNTVAGAALLIGFFSVLSRFIGLVRDRVLIQAVGVGDTLDAYYAAFRIPDTLFQLLIVGTLSASFIPLFLKYWEKNDDQAWKYANGVLTWIVGGFVLVGIACAVFASWAIALMSPGFSPEKQAMTVDMFRIILLAQCFFAGSMVFGSILQATRRFFLYSLAPIVYNVGILFGALFLVPVMGPWGIAWGAVVGAFLHMFLQGIGAYALGFSLRPSMSMGADIRATFFHMGPRTLSLAATQMNLVVMTALASTLTAGSVSILQFSYNLNFFPVGIIAVSYAIAAFPGMCDAVQKKLPSGQDLASIFSSSVRQMLFWLLPATFLFLLLRAQIVRLVLGAQNFSWDLTVLTADTLAIFAISFCAQGLVFILVRAFFAREKTAIPVLASFLGLAVNAVLAYALAPTWGILGLASAFSASAIVQCAVLLALLRVQEGPLHGREIALFLVKHSVAAFVLALVVQWVKYALVVFFPLTTFFAVFVQLLGASVAGVCAYALVAWLLRSEELRSVLAGVRRKVLKTVTPKEISLNDTSL